MERLVFAEPLRAEVLDTLIAFRVRPLVARVALLKYEVGKQPGPCHSIPSRKATDFSAAELDPYCECRGCVERRCFAFFTLVKGNLTKDR